MTDFTRVVFVATGWRRVEDESTGVVRMEALGAAGASECDTEAEPNLQGVPVDVAMSCRPISCQGACEPVHVGQPGGAVVTICECQPD